MIQDIAPHIYHNEYCPEKPDADSYLMYFERHNALARWDGVEIAFPRFRDFPEVKTELSENIIYLFTVEDSGTPSLSGCPLRASLVISSGTGMTSASTAATAAALWCMTQRSA